MITENSKQRLKQFKEFELLKEKKDEKRKASLEVQKAKLLKKAKKILKSRPKEERKIFINSRSGTFSEKFIPISEITEEDEEKETELWIER